MTLAQTAGVTPSAPSSKAKKPRAARNYPSFELMISEAIAALKERTGSSQVAIMKYIEDNHKNLPANFRKLLLIQLRRLVAGGKLVKVKASFKLPSARPTSAAAGKPKSGKPKAPAATMAVVKPKAKVAAKPKPKAKSTTAKPQPKRKAPAAAPKPSAKKSKVAKTASVTSPGKKKAAPKPKKAAPKPKSVKSPIKKTAAAKKKAKK